MSDRSGANNPNWKGGRVVDPRGYVLIRVGVDHPLSDVRGYAYEHRLIAQNELGRDLLPGEDVCRTKGKSGNAPEDLKVLTKVEQGFRRRKRSDLKMPDAPNRVTECACGCGAKFNQYDDTNRPRRYVPGHNLRRG